LERARDTGGSSREIRVPTLRPNERGTYRKLGLRRRLVTNTERESLSLGDVREVLIGTISQGVLEDRIEKLLE